MTTIGSPYIITIIIIYSTRVELKQNNISDYI